MTTIKTMIGLVATFNLLGCIAQSDRALDDFRHVIILVTDRHKGIPPEIEASVYFDDPLFLELYTNSRKMFRDLEDILLSDEDISYKLTAIRLSQCLTPDQYEAILDRVVTKYGYGILAANIVDPGTEWGELPYKLSIDGRRLSYREKITSLSRSSRFSEHTDGLLNGKKYIYQRQTGMKYPPCVGREDSLNQVDIALGSSRPGA